MNDIAKHDAARAVTLVQLGRSRSHDMAESEAYRSSLARYDAQGTLMERVLYRADGTQAEVTMFGAHGRLSVLKYGPDGLTPRMSRRFNYDDSGRLVEVRYCSSAAVDCSPWGVDTVEDWTADGRPLTGTAVRHTEEIAAGTWTYDEAGRLIETRWGRSVWTCRYDPEGRLVGRGWSAPSDDEGGQWEYAYGAAGRLVRETEIGGFVPVLAITSFSYELVGESDFGLAISGAEGLDQGW